MMIDQIPLTVHPTRQRVLLQRMAAHDPFADSILYTPDSILQPSQEAQILEVGADVDQVEAGKVAIVPQFAGTEIKFKGEWYLLLPESEIMAYVEGT